MSKRIVYFNGNYVPEKNACISIFDSALMYGDMAFEVTRTFDHKPFRLYLHLERLFRSLRLLEIDCGLSLDRMERITVETLEKNVKTEKKDVDWQIMHDVSRGPLPLYQTAFSEELQPTVSINCWPLVRHLGEFSQHYDNGVNLMISGQQTLPAHLVDMKAKTRSRIHYRMALLQADRVGGKWPVLLDPDGYLAEGPGWNLFLVKKGVLYTPEPRNILQGVSRDATIELSERLGINVVQTNLGRYEALMADEIFCTSTTFNLIHAATIDGQTIGTAKPGPIFKKLMAGWKEMVGLDFVRQAKVYAERLPKWIVEESKS